MAIPSVLEENKLAQARTRLRLEAQVNLVSQAEKDAGPHLLPRKKVKIVKMVKMKRDRLHISMRGLKNRSMMTIL
jgi:hypothetical protein